MLIGLHSQATRAPDICILHWEGLEIGIALLNPDLCCNSEKLDYFWTFLSAQEKKIGEKK